MFNNNVTILLATYNGNKFLAEQLESIIAQTHTNWYLLVRDDGSTDGTIDSLLLYIDKYPDKIKLIDSDDKNLGAMLNFFTLLGNPCSNYIMFCDQDDVWYPNKIELTLNKMLEVEACSDNSAPVLIHTDLRVVDDNLNVLSDSFWNYQNLDHTKVGLNRILTQNIITGCTVMINDKLRQLSRPYPTSAIMHDWWLALVASGFGIIECVTSPTMSYRQHSSNDTGAKRWDLSFIASRSRSIRQIISNLKRTWVQADIFLNTYHELLAEDKLVIVKAYARMTSSGLFSNFCCIFKHRILKHGFLRNIGLLFALSVQKMCSSGKQS